MSPSGPVFQNSIYVGINLQDILYGIELALYFKTMHVLLSKGRRRKSNVFYAVFSTVMLLMITIWVSTQAIIGEKMWLQNANFPGGPDAYWTSQINTWYMDLASVATNILQLMTDALMIYRCRVIWDSNKVILAPVVLWLATLVLGILVLWASGSPGKNFFEGISFQLVISYYCLSVGLTAMLTWIICHRMVVHGLRVKKHLGEDYAAAYFAILSIIIESVLPYTLSGVAFLVSFGMGSDLSIAFGYVYIPLMCISPQLLILRVASGRAWNEETGRAAPSTVRFAPVSASVWTESRCFDDSGTTVHLETTLDGKERV